MTTRQRRGSELDPTELQWWLAAEEVLGNLQQMRTILDQWHALEPENEQTQQALAKVCRHQAAQRLRDPLPNQQQIVELWLTAAELDNSSDSLLQLARAMYRDREQTLVYGRVLEALHRLPTLDAIHQSLAVAYAALGQDELAHLHQIQVE